jgi:hypothetical protein
MTSQATPNKNLDEFLKGINNTLNGENKELTGNQLLLQCWLAKTKERK